MKAKFNIKKTLCIISVILLIYLVKLIGKLNILPNKYFIPAIITLVVINVLNIILGFSKKKIMNTISIILSIMLFLSSIAGIVLGNKLANFFKNSFNNNNYETTQYAVLVLKTSDYNKIEDLNNKKIGYLNNVLEKNDYLDELKIEINKQEYKNIYELYEDLINKKIDSIVLNESYIDLLEDDYKDIMDNTKIIYSFDIKKEIKKQEETKELKPINIYISGSDSRSGLIEANSRTDVNMIMTINPETKKILLTSIPRDYYVQLHGTTGYKDKFTHSGIYGIEMSKQTLEDLFNIKIDYTIKVGFNSVVSIVDLIGGIDVYSDYEFTTDVGDGGVVITHINVGTNHLNGPQALAYARERHAFVEGDLKRVEHQQQVLEAIIEKSSKDKNIILKYDELLNSLQSLYRTDIPESLIKLYIKDQIENNKTWTVERQVVTGYGSMDITYSMPGRNLYVMIPDMDSVEKATKKINQIKGLD